MPETPSPSQTAGPFFSFGLIREEDRFLVPTDAPDAITLEGTLLDGAGQKMPDGMLEIWQADADGNYLVGPATPAFKGFARAPTDEDGRFSIVTVKPGRVPGIGSALQAPHIAVAVMGRGMLKPAWTRFYFEDDADLHADDTVLSMVPADRRHTLIASKGKRAGYDIVVRLGGDAETVFFDV